MQGDEREAGCQREKEAEPGEDDDHRGEEHQGAAPGARQVTQHGEGGGRGGGGGQVDPVGSDVHRVYWKFRYSGLLVNIHKYLLVYWKLEH